MNLLVTSAGRRDYLIEYFVDALYGRGRVHVGNSDRLCSAFTVGDAHTVTPPIQSDEYLPFLRDYCRSENIGAIIPLYDLDLTALSAARADFASVGVQVIVAGADAIDICNDKWRTVKFLTSEGIRTPRTYLDVTSALTAIKNGEINYPVMLKPRWGMGSHDVMQADDREELLFMYQLINRRLISRYAQIGRDPNSNGIVLIQEKIQGTEYGLDVFNNLEGRYMLTVAKRKLAMRSGETDIAITEDQPVLNSLGERLSSIIGQPGNLDVDLFYDGEKTTVLELNARFGGGYPFTHAAGANFPAALVAWLTGEVPDPNWLRALSGITTLKSIKPKIV